VREHEPSLVGEQVRAWMNALFGIHHTKAGNFSGTFADPSPSRDAHVLRTTPAKLAIDRNGWRHLSFLTSCHR
jgi:hypothetical protein